MQPSIIRDGKYDKTKPLEWTVDELEAFLDQKVLTMDSSDMAMLLIRIFPDQKGSPPKANKLIPGGITLRDQVRIARKYLDASGCEMLFSVLWHDWRAPNVIEDFRREVLETLPPDRYRQRGFAPWAMASTLADRRNMLVHEHDEALSSLASWVLQSCVFCERRSQCPARSPLVWILVSGIWSLNPPHFQHLAFRSLLLSKIFPKK